MTGRCPMPLLVIGCGGYGLGNRLFGHIHKILLGVTRLSQERTEIAVYYPAIPRFVKKSLNNLIYDLSSISILYPHIKAKKLNKSQNNLNTIYMQIPCQSLRKSPGSANGIIPIFFWAS